MNEKSLRVLEYKKITSMLEDAANSNMAKEIARNLQPLKNIYDINDEIRSTSEAVDLIIKKGALPLGSIYDTRQCVDYANKGGTLSMADLLRVSYNLAVTAQVVSFMRSDVPEVPVISEMVNLLVTIPRLRESIEMCILSEDEMSDNASSELKSIRRGISSKNESIRAKLNSIINSQSNKTYLQDAIITVRDGRYVVPVKQEHRTNVSGIVHDRSQTGATVFIEPQAIVILNNELRELEIAEKIEVQRILAELSQSVSNESIHLNNNQQMLIKLDFIMAKGKLSLSMEATEPIINNQGIIELVSVRNPLIDPQKVIPVTILIGKEYKSLVITGPNTGGKTVSLKTLGLITLMAQSGLHIPASSNSKLSLFENIFADIGDEQSIEQSLSTFSSHMTNIIDIIRNSDENTLVLLDELGAGTDPTEGAALAIAIIEALNKRGVTLAASTHYNEIKKYALSTEGVMNASMEFDVDTLSPTYRLNIGVVGKSNAFEISKKLGLYADIVARANELISDKEIQFESVITTIEEDKKRANEEREKAEYLNTLAKQSAIKAEKDKLVTERMRQRILQEAKEQARGIIAEAKSESEEIKKELKEISKIQSLGERTDKFQGVKKRIKDSTQKYQETFEVVEKAIPIDVNNLKIGDIVKVSSFNQVGEVIGLVDSKGEIQVRMGIIKMSVNPNDLSAVSKSEMSKVKDKLNNKSKSSYSRTDSIHKQKRMNITTSISIRGQLLDDSIHKVEKYLDDAYLSGLPQVTIIHGKGEGILKKGVHDLLKHHGHVASYRLGEFDEGGEGVTVVTFTA